MQWPYGLNAPPIADNAIVAQEVNRSGQFKLQMMAKIWCGNILRANEQKATIVHISGDKLCPGAFNTLIDDGVIIVHRALLHCCRIASRARTGIGAILLDGVDAKSVALAHPPAC